MSIIDTQSLKPNDNGQGKFKQFENQKITIFKYLNVYIATASMIAEATGIPQKSICRYKRDYEKAGLLLEVEKKQCIVTGFKAWYLTTNPALFIKSNILKMNGNE